MTASAQKIDWNIHSNETNKRRSLKFKQNQFCMFTEAI